ncbi:MAG: SCO family protein [Xanthobacteraceae bacterium]
MRAAPVFAIVLPASLMLMQPRAAFQQSALPKIAPAPEFTLTSQDGAQIALADLRGKVVAVAFIYTLCSTTCPVLTPMMSFVQDQLGPDFGKKIAFISITVDPERDTPEVLKEYAQTFGANLAGWAFLTGAPDAIRDVTRRYGVFAAKTADGDVDHTFVTSIIDPHGILRVQYIGVRFDPDEFRRDLLSLLQEP